MDVGPLISSDSTASLGWQTNRLVLRFAIVVVYGSMFYKVSTQPHICGNFAIYIEEPKTHPQTASQMLWCHDYPISVALLDKLLA